MLKFGYNTNGFPFHSLADAIELVAECGYDGIAITLDHHHLNPFTSGPAERAGVRRRLAGLGLTATVETGARYLLDRRRKHEPSFISPAGRERRIDFTLKAIETAAEIEAPVVTILSGRLIGDAPPQDVFKRLAEGCRRVTEYAGTYGVKLALEPEPGMFIERVDQFAELAAAVGHDNFRLTLDIGHVFCVEDGTIGDILGRFAPRIATVHIEDIRSGVHEHLPFGEGDIDFKAVLDSFEKAGYDGLLSVELQRHGHEAPLVARQAIDFLRRITARGEGNRPQRPLHRGPDRLQRGFPNEQPKM